MKSRKEETRGFGPSQKLFSYLLIASVVCLSLLCLFYGTTFAPSLRRSDNYDPTSGPLSRHVIGQGGGGALLASNLTVTSFPVCDKRLSELIPCSDRNLLYQMRLKLNLSLMEHYERHCPPQWRRYNCLIPPPSGYKVPIRWPASRDEVWKANIPHTHLASEKSDQRWMVVNGDKINFPGGGTHFHFGADKYIMQIAQVWNRSDVAQMPLEILALPKDS